MPGGNTSQARTTAAAAATATVRRRCAKADPANPDQSTPGQGQSGSGDKLSSQVFGGGPIVGVASTSKAQSIREFNHKNHYDKWQFIYDPTMDRGGLITTPAQPALQVAAPLQQNPVDWSESPPGRIHLPLEGRGSGCRDRVIWFLEWTSKSTSSPATPQQ